jgi:hypothetical protein
MAANTCPHCGQTAISSAQKLFLGPVRALSCRSCHRAVTVPIASLGPGIGLMLALLVLSNVLSGPYRIWPLVAGIVLIPVIAWHQLARVPLVAPR